METESDRTTRLSYDAHKPNFRDKMQTMENLIDTPRLPRKRRSLAQELVTVLTEQIRDGLLKRGDKLPTESAIMEAHGVSRTCLLYTSPSPRDRQKSRMPSSA